MSKFFNYMKKFLTLSFILTISAFCLSLNCIASDTNVPDSQISSDIISGNTFTDPDTGNIFELQTPSSPDVTDVGVIWKGNEKQENVIVVPKEVNKTTSDGDVVTYKVVNFAPDRVMRAVRILDLDITNEVTNDRSLADKLPNLVKMILRFDENEESSATSRVESEKNSSVYEMLEQNSLTGNAAIYFNREENLAGVESDLFYADAEDSDISTDGLEYKWDEENDKWILTSFPNNSMLVIPAAFVDLNDFSLKKIEGVAISDKKKTDKIQKIVVTNIQDDGHKEKILKFARMILPGLENNVDDSDEWTISDEVSSTGRLIFNKAQRNLTSVLYKLMTNIPAWAKTSPWARLDKNGIMKEFKSIVDKEFKKAPKGAKELKDYLMMLMESFVASDKFDTFVDALKAVKDNLTINTGSADSSALSSTAEIDFVDAWSKANMGGLEGGQKIDLANGAADEDSYADRVSSYLIDINDESSQEELPLTTIIFNTLSALKDWAKDEPWKRLDNDGMMREFKAIVDKNFEKASKYAKNIKDLFMGNLAWFISSDQFDYFIDLFKALKQQLLTSSDEDASSEIPVDLNDMEKQYEVDTITTPNETDKPEENSYDDGQSPSDTQIQPSVTYEKILADWKSWKENAGKNVTYADQMKYLRDLLLQSLSSLNATDRESATNAINLINSKLEKMNNTTQNTGSGSQTLNNSSSTGSTNSNVQTSAKTKTADSNISPELMSLVLSGALSGIVVSLKKNKE